MTRGNTLTIVMELCERGSLGDYLKSQLRRGKSECWPVKFRMARDVSRGMAKIHASSILHLDLAARNVLLKADGTCKVADFGLAAAGLYYQASASRPLAVRWMAPEVLAQEDATSASDVWSFGVFVYELANNADALPYAALSNAAVVAAVQEGRQLELMEDAPPVVGLIMHKCMSLDRHERPSFQELAEYLAELHEHALAASPAPTADGPPQPTEATDSVSLLPSPAVAASPQPLLPPPPPSPPLLHGDYVGVVSRPQPGASFVPYDAVYSQPTTPISATTTIEYVPAAGASPSSACGSSGYERALWSGAAQKEAAQVDMSPQLSPKRNDHSPPAGVSWGGGEQSTQNEYATYLSRRLAKQMALSDNTLSATTL